MANSFKYKTKSEKPHKETLYLLKSPANAKRLLNSLKEYEKGLGQERSLIEDDK